MLAFTEDIGSALAKACELDNDSEAVCLCRAAEIVGIQMFEKPKPLAGFAEVYQKESVPPLLLTLVRMILEGPSITDQTERRRKEDCVGYLNVFPELTNKL